MRAAGTGEPHDLSGAAGDARAPTKFAEAEHRELMVEKSPSADRLHARLVANLGTEKLALGNVKRGFECNESIAVAFTRGRAKTADDQIAAFACRAPG